MSQKLSEESQPERMLAEVITSLEKEEFEEVEGYFGGKMSNKADELPNAWKKTKSIFGDFEGFTKEGLEYSKKENVAKAHLIFGGKEFEAKAGFNESEKITSFNIQPSGSGGTLNIFKHVAKTKFSRTITTVGEKLGVIEPEEVRRKKEATNLIEDLDEDRYGKALERFGSMAKDMLTPEELERVWNDFEEKYGEFENIEDLEYIDNENKVEMEFLMGGERFEGMVVFGHDGVQGIGVDEGDEEADYSKPDYADTDAFEEHELKVGGMLDARLTAPSETDSFPVVILVHGTGAHDKDETLMDNKPFKDLAWGLGSNGIGVLRYDKRTKVTGLNMSSESFDIEKCTINDAVAAVELVKGKEPIEEVFVLGHSLGGYVGPWIAEKSEVDGIISMGGSTRDLPDIVEDQMEYKKELGDEKGRKLDEVDEVEKEVERIKKGELEDDEVVFGYSANFWRSISDYDPVEKAQEIDVPMLILQGGRDYQVTDEDFEGWKTLEGQIETEFCYYPKLNHLFMPGEGKPDPEEYKEPNDVSEKVIDDIRNWVSSVNQSVND